MQLGAVVGADDLDDELGRVGSERHLALAGEVGEQADAGAVGGSQQRDPAGAEVVEVDRVRHPAVAERAHRAAVGVRDRGEGVAVVVGEGHPTEAVVAAGERLPRDPRADPGAADSRHDRTDAQLLAPGALGGASLPRPGRRRLDEDADRRVLRLDLAVVEEAAEGSLPGGTSLWRGASGEAVEDRLALTHRRGDGHGVLAVAGDRAGAGAVPAGDVEASGGGSPHRGEGDAGRVGLAVAAADPPGRLPSVVGDVEVDDVPVLGVGEAARDRHGAADLVELLVREVGDAVDGEHATHHTTSTSARRAPARPIPEHPTVCRAADIRGTHPQARGPRHRPPAGTPASGCAAPPPTSCDLRTVLTADDLREPSASRTKSWGGAPPRRAGVTLPTPKQP